MKHGLRRRIERLAGVPRPRRRAGGGPARVAWPPRPVAPVQAAPVQATPHSTAGRGLGAARAMVAAVRRWGTVLAIGAVFVYVVAGVALALQPRMGCRLARGMRPDARVVESAAMLWMAENAGCPSLEDLPLSHYGRRYDVWGAPFRIDCSGDSPAIWSAGPDGQGDTEDDIHF